MKVDLKGLLLMAKRHLAILDKMQRDLQGNWWANEMEVESASLILDELIQHVSEVQADNSRLNEFAELYCLVKPVHSNAARVDAIWEQAVKDVQARYDELLETSYRETLG